MDADQVRIFWQSEVVMELRFLGSTSNNGGSPTLYATDRGTYLVQGWKVADQAALAGLAIPGQETVVEIPKELLAFADRSVS
jgi:hypothetical protein